MREGKQIKSLNFLWILIYSDKLMNKAAVDMGTAPPTACLSTNTRVYKVKRSKLFFFFYS